MAKVHFVSRQDSPLEAKFSVVLGKAALGQYAPIQVHSPSSCGNYLEPNCNLCGHSDSKADSLE